MREASISLSCSANMSTCLLRYCSLRNNAGGEICSGPLSQKSQMTIQVLAAFSRDGFFNNNVLQVNKLV